MSKKFSIYGDIVQEADKQNQSDVCLQDFKNFLDTLEPGEPATIEICSVGGDVFQGIGICNLIKQARENGHHFTAHVISLAASIASVICCACDEIMMDSNALFMAHLPWTVVQGNEIDLAKEIEQLEQCKRALISFYRSKFLKSDEEIEQMLVAETWIDAASARENGLICTVLDNDNEMRIAAKFIDKLSKFNNKTYIQKVLDMKNIKNEKDGKEVVKESEQKVDSPAVTEEAKPAGDNPAPVPSSIPSENDNAPAAPAVEPAAPDENNTKKASAEEEPKEEEKETEKEPTVEELKAEIARLKKCLEEYEEEKNKPVEARVAGMQSTMQNKINSLTKDFKDQLDAVSKELATYKDEATSLKAKLDTAESELHEVVSALEEKTNALATLNASVNTPGEEDKNEWKKLHGKEFFDWVKKNKIH